MYKFCNSFKIGNLHITNRIVRSATYLGMATDDGKITDKLIDVLKILALNKIGLITTGFMYIMKNGKSAPRQLGIYNDSHIIGLRRLVDSIKNCSTDTKIFAQLAHGGKQILGVDPSDFIPVAPSAIKDKLSGIIPKEMTSNEIKECIRNFILAANRAYSAGFDGIQLHCAHGYLLSEFLSPYCNKRTDDYGGNIQNRFKIISEIISGIHDTLGKEFPITAKLNVSDFVKDFPQLTIDESKIIAKMMVDIGVSAIETSGGLFESAMYGNLTASRVNIKTPHDEAYFLTEAKIIKKTIGDTPVILVGGIRSRDTVEFVLNEGIDFVALSRPLIREPDLILKWIKNTSNKAECISCNRCLFSLKPPGVECIPLKKLKRKLGQ
ncbi:MAG: NADH:flavin oxidoreductase [Candidatus Helarchaeota archaeon]